MAPTDTLRVQVMGLWKAQGRNGEYFRGKLGGLMIWVFPNDRKKHPAEPDFRVFASEDRPPARGQTEAPRIRWTAPAPTATGVDDPELTPPDDFIGDGGSNDDIPF